MELKIISDNEDKLLSRREIKFVVEDQSSTTDRYELTKEICKKLNINPEFTLVVRIDQGFGNKESSGIAHSYKSKELLEKFEPAHIISRIKKSEEKRKSKEKPKEEAKPEGAKPAEAAGEDAASEQK